MNILALDTCLGACSAAVLADGQPRAAIVEAMIRGHQERLGGLVRETMAAAGLDFSTLDRIAVTVGPGSFTGLRVGLAFAKGLALALKRPCIGVGALEAMAASAEAAGLVGACLDAGRGQIYLQLFVDGRSVSAPDVLSIQTAAARLAELWTGGSGRLIGSAAALLAQAAPGAEIIARIAPDPVAVARLAARAAPPFAPPRPLYLRAPDARLPQP
jgi:tRNA threonylcarbamoyladenosine biosynthesis protein TsaB